MGKKERIAKKNTAKLEFTELGYWIDMNVGKRKEKEKSLDVCLDVENYKTCGLIEEKGV